MYQGDQTLELRDDLEKMLVFELPEYEMDDLSDDCKKIRIEYIGKGVFLVNGLWEYERYTSIEDMEEFAEWLLFLAQKKKLERDKEELFQAS